MTTAMELGEKLLKEAGGIFKETRRQENDKPKA